MKKHLGDYIKEYSVRNKENQDIPVYSVTNTGGFCQDYFGKEVASKDKSTYKIVPQGYFAYNPSRINVGSVDWQRNQERVIVSPLYNVFSVSDKLNRQYLYYYLKSDFALQRIKAVATGSVRDNLKIKMLYEFPINVPELSVQENIVEVLDKIKELEKLKKSELNQLDTLVKARFVESFGDPVQNNNKYPEHSLGDDIDFLTSGSRGWAKYYSSKGKMFITIKNVKCGHISMDNIQYINPPDNAEARRTKVQAGDLLISITADLGRTGVVTKEIAKKGAYINQHLMCVRLDKKILLPEFVSFFMESQAGKRQFYAKNQNAVKAGLNFDAIKTFKIMVPPLEKQNEYVSFTERVNKSKVAIDYYVILIRKALQSRYHCVWGN